MTYFVNVFDRSLKTVLLAIAILATGCSDFIEIGNPTHELPAKAVFSDNTSADGAVAGIYREMIASVTHFAGGGTQGGITPLAAIYADELYYNQTAAPIIEFASSELKPDNIYLYNLWSSAYKTIYMANAVLQGLDAHSGVTQAVSRRLRGEALFLRAFAYFYLTNCFGDVPLVKTTDYRINNQLGRDSHESVMDQVIADLVVAKDLLPVNFDLTEQLRIRVTHWAASAMLARAYLYRRQWAEAEAEASNVLNAPSLFSLETELDGVFLKSSKEAIWQLMAIASNRETNEGNTAIPLPTQAAPPTFTFRDHVLEAFSPADRRMEKWVNQFTVKTTNLSYNYPFKYKVRTATNSNPNSRTEFSMVLRLAEQYLIRSEARLHLGDLQNATADLNEVRFTHGGLLPLVITDSDELMAAIERERLVEFFYEWGHRWFDLVRWGKVAAALSPVKPTWRPTAILFPVPQRELEANPALLPQNTGY